MCSRKTLVNSYCKFKNFQSLETMRLYTQLNVYLHKVDVADIYQGFLVEVSIQAIQEIDCVSRIVRVYRNCSG